MHSAVSVPSRVPSPPILACHYQTLRDLYMISGSMCTQSTSIYYVLWISLRNIPTTAVKMKIWNKVEYENQNYEYTILTNITLIYL